MTCNVRHGQAKTPSPRQIGPGAPVAGSQMLAPAVLLLTFFLIVPFFLSFWTAMTNQPLVPPAAALHLVHQLVRIFHDSVLAALFNVSCFAFWILPVQCGLAFATALLLHQKMPFRNLLRGMFSSRDHVHGGGLRDLGNAVPISDRPLQPDSPSCFGGYIQPIDWLGDPEWAMFSIVLLSAWQAYGFQMIVYLAGLQGIPDELYDAARIDGANAVQRFWHVTMPGLRPTHVFVLLITTIQAFKLYTQVEHSHPGRAARAVPKPWSSTWCGSASRSRSWACLGRLGHPVRDCSDHRAGAAPTLEAIRCLSAAAEAPLPGKSDRSSSSSRLHLIVALVIVSPLFLLVVASLKDDRFQILADMGSFRAFWVSNPTLNNFKEVGHFSGNWRSAGILSNSTAHPGDHRRRGRDRQLHGRLRPRLGCDERPRGNPVDRHRALRHPAGKHHHATRHHGIRAGMTDTFAVQIVPWIASPLYIFLFYQFFAQLPKELLEAAQIDGASIFPNLLDIPAAQPSGSRHRVDPDGYRDLEPVSLADPRDADGLRPADRGGDRQLLRPGQHLLGSRHGGVRADDDTDPRALPRFPALVR